ncbi:MAG: HPr family phosphocarrier protein [Lachnospiraceae bacterium]|nr:HPr family phosphocarrier protein [Lachnospiraceae bacterium]
MKTRDVVVNVKEDEDARPIAVLVQVASQYESSVYINSGSRHVNAKSIMGMMSLALKNGEEVTVEADGNDEEQAADGIVDYLAGNLSMA